jgi:glutamine synthetase
VGQRHIDAGDAEVSAGAPGRSSGDLVALVCCDLGAIVRGRSLFASELDAHMQAGVGWVPANHALTPLGPIAEPNPYGSTGDLRLLPDPDTRVRIDGWTTRSESNHNALELLLCDIVHTDGRPWECCPRRFLRDALEELEREFDLHLAASFEHEFQLMRDAPAQLPFSLQAQRAAEPFATDVMRALVDAGTQPERFFAEFAAHQFEIPVAPAAGLASADRAVVLREVVREVARGHDLRASFVPLLDPAAAGNGVHIHLNLLDSAENSVFYDPQRPACLSDLGGRFAAGILRHARALSALTAPSPVSGARLRPHRWSAGAACLADRNREALLRIPPLVSLGDGYDPARQLHLEYRGADAAANPHLALGAILRAGIEGLRLGLDTPPILERDPAELDQVEAERYGVGALPGSLEDALRALSQDDTARAWMAPLLYDGYVSLKRAELAAVADLDIADACRRYALAY